MGINAGNLLWNRRRITLAVGATEVETGITQAGKAFAASSDGEPPLGVEGTVAPAPGALPASRVQVIPLAPMLGWMEITHSEPFYDTATGTVHVTFTNAGKTPVEINVLFWDPHTLVGPGQADTYLPAIG